MNIDISENNEVTPEHQEAYKRLRDFCNDLYIKYSDYIENTDFYPFDEEGNEMKQYAPNTIETLVLHHQNGGMFRINRPKSGKKPINYLPVEDIEVKTDSRSESGDRIDIEYRFEDGVLIREERSRTRHKIPEEISGSGKLVVEHLNNEYENLKLEMAMGLNNMPTSAEETELLINTLKECKAV